VFQCRFLSSQNVTWVWLLKLLFTVCDGSLSFLSWMTNHCVDSFIFRFSTGIESVLLNLMLRTEHWGDPCERAYYSILSKNLFIKILVGGIVAPKISAIQQTGSPKKCFRLCMRNDASYAERQEGRWHFTVMWSISTGLALSSMLDSIRKLAGLNIRQKVTGVLRDLLRSFRINAGTVLWHRPRLLFSTPVALQYLTSSYSTVCICTFRKLG
jgi:hypothetical protein